MDEGRIVQIASSQELVRSPVSVRVAELVGYTSFLPHASGRFWALHPDRFVAGACPERGIVVRGRVRSVQPFGPRFACELAPDALATKDGLGAVPAGTSVQTLVRVHTDVPPQVGDDWEVTALQPPLVERL